MRIGAGLGLLICCAGLTACTAAAPTGSQVTVTTPSVGRPPTPDSAQALAVAVRQYKAAYAKELGQLSRLLTTAPTTPASGRVRLSTS
jgi:ABC-type glycerol-3-phosphate transport system substrate-binding protein